MYVVLVYDVNAKRVVKAMKICRKYLHHVQNSVFEGSITEGQLENLKAELYAKVMPEDSVMIYKTTAPGFLKKDKFGAVKRITNII